MSTFKSCLRFALVPAFLLAACGDAEDSGLPPNDLDAAPGVDGSADGGTARGARIETRIASAAAEKSGTKMRGGAASAGELESLRYYVRSIRICESLEARGSGFDNPRGCVELYRGDESKYAYQPSDDYRPLAAAARQSDQGFVDLMSASSRAQLSQGVALTREHVRSYHYGIITWALPIKLRASVQLGDGSRLYTHDGETRFETTGSDNFRAYFTEAARSLSGAPAEDAVIVLPNGGNWFKFQSPLVIGEEDISSAREFVLDLVFNPDGIVKAFRGDGIRGNLRERADGGVMAQAFTVPMLDLAPVPHRASERVVRESYQGEVALEGNAFDLRVELYRVEGDASETVYGVDVKSLINARTSAVPPEVTKVARLDRGADGALTLQSFTGAPIVTGLLPVRAAAGSTRVSVACGTHSDRMAAEGGAAFVVDRCPAARLDVTLTLRERTIVGGGIPVATGTPDAGADAAIAIGMDAGR